MATCTNDKFVINKGMSNEFILTIKQNDSTLPMIIENTDTFNAYLIDLETQIRVGEINSTTATTAGIIEIFDAPNGQIKLKLDLEFVNTLTSSRGDKVDKYYLKPTYRLAIDCDTVNNGSFVAKINNVYVEE